MKRLAVAVAFAAVVVTASPARALFHIAVIDEVMIGVNGDPHAQQTRSRPRPGSRPTSRSSPSRTTA